MTKVQTVSQALAGSRYGISVRELASLTGLDDVEVSALLLRLEGAGHAARRTVGRDIVWKATASVPGFFNVPYRDPGSATLLSLPPIAGHLHLDLADGAVRLVFNDLRTLRDFINDLTTRSLQ